ncbi:DUF262 domain-containing protein [Bifidobacterium sp. ESL0769]|uniref:GmrSD restriction endonuclease domain-containing protein n=1 Tax=Bifidobacterium sp. ESL0769 TaxID=2983229 RepID=UPI0023FA33BF|nr:DUF262 domain-containing protein [Bifidobacterium sp. ESL0769]WEV68053.1 DUF262 domain-containing protein [Bifidobacterium sp. ESL0769]
MNDIPFQNGQSITFWQLISHYAIHIPTIQRDYVYGRSDKATNSVRSGVLDEVKEHLISGKYFSFNFIYGEIDTTSQGDIVPICKPLDGQQRLTTLYFIYWSALVQMLVDTPEADVTEAVNVLSRFSYETRQTAKDFFELMSQERIIRDIAMWSQTDNNHQHLSSFIEEKHWFRPDFLYDPTIISALVVLDEIRGKSVISNPNQWALLTGADCPIRFEWLDIEDIGNGDELYIKMNARGKQLSDFESLKAELEEKSKDLLPDRENLDFRQKMDGAWTDFFWDAANNNTANDNRNKYDAWFMQFLNWSLWNQWAERIKADTNYKLPSEILAEEITHQRRLSDYECGIPENAKTICIETLHKISHYLDYVSQKDSLDEIVHITRHISDPNQSIDYGDRMRLESAMTYVDGMYALHKQPEAKSWKQWNRIITHLSEAAQIWQGYNTLGQYTQAVKAVASFQPYADNLINYFAQFPDIQGFTPHDQIEEEELKSWLIAKSTDWTEAIEKAEDITYFQGKIGFLFAFINIDKTTKNTALTQDNLLDKFNQYVALTSVIFPDEETEELSVAFHRALLTKGDYSLKQSSIYSYLTREGSFTRSISWKNLLRDGNRRNPPDEKRYLIRDLYDDILQRIEDCNHLTTSEIIPILNQITEEYQWDSNRQDWQSRALIEHPETWAYLGSLKQYRIEDKICYLPIGNNTQLNGRNSELDACVICGELKHEADCTLYVYVGRLYPGDKYDKPFKYLSVSKGNAHIAVGKEYIITKNDSGIYDAIPVITITNAGKTDYYDTTKEAIQIIEKILSSQSDN